jgi:hypothetical protein
MPIYTKTITEIQRLNDYKLNDVRNYADSTENLLSVLKTELCTNTTTNKFTPVAMKHVKFEISIGNIKSLLISGGVIRNKLATLTDTDVDSELAFITDAFFCRDQDVTIHVMVGSTGKKYGVLGNFFLTDDFSKAILIATFWDDEISDTDLASITSIGVSGAIPENLFYLYNKDTYFPDSLVVNSSVTPATYKKQDGTTYTGAVTVYNGLTFPSFPKLPHLGVSFSLVCTASFVDDYEYGPIILENTNNTDGKYRVKISAMRSFQTDMNTMQQIRDMYKNRYFYNGNEEILPTCVSIVVGTQFQIEGNALVSRSMISSTRPSISDMSGYVGYRKLILLSMEHDYKYYEDEPFYRKNMDIVPISVNLVVSENGFSMYLRDQSVIDNNNAFICIQYPVSTTDDVAKDVTKGSKVYTKYDPLFCLYKTTNSYISSNESSVKYFIVRERDINVPMEIHSDAGFGSATTNPIMNLRFPVSITESNEYVVNFPSNLATTRFVYPNAEIDLIGYVSSDVLAEGSIITTTRFGAEREYVGLQTVSDTPGSARILMYNRTL